MSSAEALLEFGIVRGDDLTHKPVANGDINAVRYFAEAEELLDRLVPVVEGPVVDELGDYADRWNPGGFMVFSLGVHATMGSLRMHVWPEGEQRQTNTGPHVHSHAWHLISRVLRGEYQDAKYTIVDAKEQSGEGPKLYRAKRLANGTDDLRTDGRVVRPIIRDKRSIPEGKSHSIEAGEFHIPTIPAESSVVTLVLDSPAFKSFTGVLLNQSPDTVSRVRRPVDEHDVAIAQALLGR